MKTIKVLIWNEFYHEKAEAAVAEIYPQGIHAALKAGLAAPDLQISCATLEEPEHGLTEERLKECDVLIWWGHLKHHAVADEVVERVARHVQEGMGLIALHSAHYSKIFRRLCGSSCALKWRESGEKERLWCVAPHHPIARNVPETFVVPHTEMYGERFDLPEDAKIVFLSWYQGGEVLRSGITLERGFGRIFYFSPGHERFPIYYQPEILQILGNAVRWAAPESRREITAPSVPNLEPIG